jgi:large subunit ribosomal protein L25
MAEAVLKVQKREKQTKSYVKQLRRQGMVPGIYYAHGEEPIPIVLDLKELHRLASQEVNIFDLDFGEGERKPSIIKDVQYDPVKGTVIHVDMMGIKRTEKVTVTVPLHVVGTPVGVREMGGVLEHPLREVEIRCLPGDIPNALEVDVSHLKINEVIHIKDLQFEGIEIMEEPDTLVAQVLPPKVEAEVVETVEEEEAEPEVVSKEEKKEKEEESEEKKE